MLKKLLSGIIAGTMLLSSMAMVVSADDTQYAAGKCYVGTEEFDTFAEAHSAVADGGTIIVSGEIAVNARQGVSKNITISGVNNAKFVTSENFANSSETNRKALFTIAADVTVNDVAFDGSEYGETVSDRTDFIVVRANQGTVVLNNVDIKGSKKTLLSVGMSSTSADVTATNLTCQGRTDRLPLTISLLSTVYSDVDVANGTFELMSGEVNGFIGTSGGTFENRANNHYTLKNNALWRSTSTTSTIKHYSETYSVGKAAGANYVSTFVNSINREDNLTVVGKMTTDAVAMVSTDRPTVEKFLDLLQDAYTASGNSTIQGYVNTLTTALQ